MYDHILTKERKIKWTYGDTTCAEYPLTDLDSVTSEGRVNSKSAVHVIVYGKEVTFDKVCRLDAKYFSYKRKNIKDIKMAQLNIFLHF